MVEGLFLSRIAIMEAPGGFPSRAELSALIPAVQLTHFLGPHHIPSESSECTHFLQADALACQCVLEFTCPLCQFEYAGSLSVMEKHYEETHWARKVEIGKFSLFPCGLLHASSSRISVALVSSALHYHCPVCISSTFTHVENLIRHCSSSHSAASLGSSANSWQVEVVDRISPLNETVGEGLGGSSSRVRFYPTVGVRTFPLAQSILEQAGGRTETKHAPASFTSWCEVSELKALTSTEVEVSGCNVGAIKIFKALCFLVCGTDIPASTFSAIHSLGGSVSGAGYAESGEWARITHVLLGNRVGLRSVRNLRRNAPPLDPPIWVSSEWVRSCVEKGSLFRSQRVFSPAAIERFFTVRDASLRADRRKSSMKTVVDFRSSPTMSSIVLSANSSPRTSPPILGFEEASIPFMGSPELSPVIISLAATGACIAPTPATHACTTLPALPPLPRKPKHQTALPLTSSSNSNALTSWSEESPLRRSKRLSMAVSPGLATHIPKCFNVHAIARIMRRAQDLKPEFKVNVYNASADESVPGIPGCCGAYHSGIEINGTEYAFGSETGVYECRPGDYGNPVQSVNLGQAALTNAEVASAIARLRQTFTGDKYHVILNNCNHFSDALAHACSNSGIPAWINRAAWWASWFKCCFSSDPQMGRPADNQPLLAPPRQVAPMFAGDGMVLQNSNESKQLTAEEQRQARLRRLQQ